MGKTFSTGLLTDGISQDSSNNIGIGVAPSGTNKFEVSGSTKLNGNTAITGSLTVSSSANAIILPAGQTIGLGTAQIYTGTGGNSGNIFIQGAQTKLYADKVVLEAATAAGVEVIGATTLSGSLIVSGSATTIGATTLSGSLNVSGSITSTSTITAQTLVVQTITSSVLYSSGSNIFGNSLSNTQVMTGSVGITGSLTLNNIAIPTSASLASTYLQLAGGTLTGALGGTSATFNSNVGIGGATISSMTAVSGIELVQGSQIASRILANVPQLYISSNVAGDSYAPTYKVNGYATQYRLQGYDGTHVFYTAPSGTAGNAITFTGSLTITPTGNVGIGTSSPSVKLHLSDTTNGFVGLRLEGSGSYAGTDWIIYASSLSPSSADDFLGFYNNSTTDGATADYKFRLFKTGVANFSGSVGINTTIPSASLDVQTSSGVGSSTASGLSRFITAGTTTAISIGQSNNVRKLDIGAYYINVTGEQLELNTVSNQPIIFNTNALERMRIGSTTSQWDLMVGATSAYQGGTGRGSITINGSTQSILTLGVGGTNKAYIYHEGTQMYIENSVSGGSLTVISGGANGVILNSGATSWTAVSDERLKNINSNIESAVDKLNTLRTVNFSWKSDSTNKENLGLIAQDVEKVFPQVIDKSKLPSKPEKEQIDETEYLGVRYQELVPVLVKAIQELSAQIKELQS